MKCFPESSRRALPWICKHVAIILQTSPDNVNERPLRVAGEEMCPDLQYSQAKVRGILEVCRTSRWICKIGHCVGFIDDRSDPVYYLLFAV